jgi:hypothetical protein
MLKRTLPGSLDIEPKALVKVEPILFDAQQPQLLSLA